MWQCSCWLQRAKLTPFLFTLLLWSAYLLGGRKSYYHLTPGSCGTGGRRQAAALSSWEIFLCVVKIINIIVKHSLTQNILV